MHRALAVLGNQDMTACGWRTALCGGESNIDAERVHVVIEYGAELVGFDLADVRSRAAKVGKSCDGIGDRAA